MWHFQSYFFSCLKSDERVKFLKLLTNHSIQVIFNSNMTDVTSGAGTAYPSEASAFTLVFCVVHIAQPFVFCKLFCRSLFVLFLLVIVLPALLRFTAFDSPISIPRPFFLYIFDIQSPTGPMYKHFRYLILKSSLKYQILKRLLVKLLKGTYKLQ